MTSSFIISLGRHLKQRKAMDGGSKTMEHLTSPTLSSEAVTFSLAGSASLQMHSNSMSACILGMKKPLDWYRLSTNLFPGGGLI